MDHDQRFKTLIREFFAQFLWLFFGEWAAKLDLTTIEWLDKEVLPNPPEGLRHQLDLVAKIGANQAIRLRDGGSGSVVALVHIEIESDDSTTDLKRRLPSYYVHLREEYGLPVLPIVIYLKVGLEGIGIDSCEERFWELDVLRFRYLYVGLPALNGLKYVAGDNWLGVALAALMKIPRDQVAWLGAEALRRLTEAPITDQQRFLLADCVEAYLPLLPEQQQEYERLLLGTSSKKVQAMNKTTYDKGIEQGMRVLLLKQGRARFGPPSKEVESNIASISDGHRLEELGNRILFVSSWDELLKSD